MEQQQVIERALIERDKRLDGIFFQPETMSYFLLTSLTNGYNKRVQTEGAIYLYIRIIVMIIKVAHYNFAGENIFNVKVMMNKTSNKTRRKLHSFPMKSWKVSP